MSSARKLDQFYTSAPVAKVCWELAQSHIPSPDSCVYLEPSAGAGAFFSLMPKGRRIGLDLEPKHADVAKQDFFEFMPASQLQGALVTVGNPPFGKNASLAVRFFNHAAEFSAVIAFIVPKSFKKSSVQKRLNTQFHLVKDVELGENAFEFEGAPYDVPCCFQIWEKRSTPRVVVEDPLEHPDFSFVTRDAADFAVRRVGALAGKVIPEFETYSDASHYFIKVASKARVKAVIRALEAADWTEAKANNAGNPSISKRELVRGYAAVIAEGAPRERLAA